MSFDKVKLSAQNVRACILPFTFMLWRHFELSLYASKAFWSITFYALEISWSITFVTLLLLIKYDWSFFYYCFMHNHVNVYSNGYTKLICLWYIRAVHAVINVKSVFRYETKMVVTNREAAVQGINSSNQCIRHCFLRLFSICQIICCFLLNQFLTFEFNDLYNVHFEPLLSSNV